MARSAIKKVREIWRRFGYYLRRDRFDRELEAEMRFHLEMKTRARIAAGASAKEAERATRVQFGNAVLLQERSREMWSLRWIEELVQDLRYSFRMIRKSPALAGVVVSSLALAIGANTAIFSLVDAVLLKRLQVKNPDQLVLLSWGGPRPTPAHWISGSTRTDPGTREVTSTSFSSDQYLRMREVNKTLSEMFAFAPIYEKLNLSVDSHADVATGQVVTGSYYRGMAVEAIIGRTINDDDDSPGADPVAVITYKCWKQRFGLDPSAIGKSVQVNALPVTIVGVTPDGFEGALEIGDTADVTIPLAAQVLITRRPSEDADNWKWWLRVMGRLAPGASFEQVRANLEGAFQQSALEGHQTLLAKDPANVPDPVNTPRLIPASGSQGLVAHRGDHSRQLYVLLIVVGLVLLIACANTANLLLARSSARQKEIAVRIALGAGRGRLIRQLLTESLTLAILGGAAGLVLAYWAKGFLLLAAPWGGEPLKLDLTLNGRVLLFTAGTAIATGLVFGVAPAFKATRVETAPALKESSASQTPGRRRTALGRALVLIQVAVSLVLLVGAGLFLRTLHNLERVDYGFDANNLLLFKVDASLNGYKGENLVGLYDRISERISGLPGVTQTTMSEFPLLSGEETTRSRLKIIGATDQPDPSAGILILEAKGNFLEAMHIPILTGRSLAAADPIGASRVAVVNEAFVKLGFGSENPLGRTFKFGENARTVYEVVGVARNARYDSLRGDISPAVYLQLPHVTNGKEAGNPSLQSEVSYGVTFEVRAAGNPMELVPAVRQTLRDIDSNIAPVDITTQQRVINDSLSNERLFAGFTVALGCLALLLAAIGLYGTLSYNVSQRTSEIGIRMALGAVAGRVMVQVIRQTMTVVVIGIVIGVAASITVTRLISAAMLGLSADPDAPSMLFGVKPGDPMSVALAAVVLLAVALAAGYLPARRASRIDPIRALRYE
jgi:predicted permease